MKAYEFNFDGLVGPSHNYAGLSSGNVASMSNAGETSSPKLAAKQGLKKAKALSDLGVKQGILAPHIRPNFDILRQLGFFGSEKNMIEKAYKKAPEILAACYSASAMWTANAATVSPSADTKNHKVHLTPANLNNKFHRSIEPDLTSQILKQTFKDESVFQHHAPLPSVAQFGDEGAANHTRFCNDYGERGVEFFVFGKYGFRKDRLEPKKFVARQTFEASRAIAQLHELDDSKVVFAQQNPDVIDQGVFHNDVISVGDQNVYFYHEKALLNTSEVLSELSEKMEGNFTPIMVPHSAVSVEDAVTSYLFNSQLLTLNSGKKVIVVPKECEENRNVWSYLTQLTNEGGPIKETLVYDVKESMKNGGGPACLRLRVVLTEEEINGVNPKTILNDELFQTLNHWVDKHYRDEIKPSDLSDPKLADEIRTALDELSQILGLGAVYG